MRYRFLILDVFSATPFGGNQLAVLTDARGLGDEGMQAIAREFNFPESTFVLPAEDPANTRRVRIFTPARELPFAGHPTVGTACALVIDGQAEPGPVTLEEGIGPVRAEVARDHGALHAAFSVDQAPEVKRDAADAAAVAAALSLAEADVERVFVGLLGIEFLFVQLSSREAVDRAIADADEARRLVASNPQPNLYLFAGELADGADIYARLFAPGFGIPEDPATGSAAAILAGAGALLSGAPAGPFRLSIAQGVAMGRPSRLAATAFLQGGAVQSVGVGGAAAFVAEGEIEVPDALIVR